MDDLLVHRRTEGCRIAAIPLEGRLGATGPHQLLRQRIEVPGRHAGRHRLGQLRQDAGHEGIGHPHPLNLAGRLADNHRCTPRAAASASAASMAAVTTSGGRFPSIWRKVGRVE